MKRTDIELTLENAKPGTAYTHEIESKVSANNTYIINGFSDNDSSVVISTKYGTKSTGWTTLIGFSTYPTYIVVTELDFYKNILDL